MVSILGMLLSLWDWRYVVQNLFIHICFIENELWSLEHLFEQTQAWLCKEKRMEKFWTLINPVERSYPGTNHGTIEIDTKDIWDKQDQKNNSYKFLLGKRTTDTKQNIHEEDQPKEMVTHDQ